MKWSDYYERVFDYTDTTKVKYLNNLEFDVKNGEEVIEVAFELPSDKDRDKLIKMALENGVIFKIDSFRELEGFIDDAIFEVVIPNKKDEIESILDEFSDERLGKAKSFNAGKGFLLGILKGLFKL